MLDIKSTTEKNGPALRAIVMAMRIRRYGAERISQYGRYGYPRCQWTPPSGESFYSRNGTRNPSSINTTPSTNIITMVFRFPPLWRRFNELPQSDEWVAIRRGWPRALRRGFI